MSDLEILEKTGTDAVKRLRKSELDAGGTFMINSSQLPAKQSYLEYPDGTIEVVTIGDDARSFITLRTLTPAEAHLVLSQNDLL
jgi:hypothetical protein